MTKSMYKKKINLLELNGIVIEGENQGYLSLIDFVETNSLDNLANFNYVAEKIDIDNFIHYNVAQIYFNNLDWPGNNIKFLNSPDTKWRWIYTIQILGSEGCGENQIILLTHYHTHWAQRLLVGKRHHGRPFC